MTWDDRIVGVSPEQVSFNEHGLVIAGQQYYCDHPRLEFARCLLEIDEMRFGGEFREQDPIHPTAIVGHIGFGFERDESGVPIRIPHFASVIMGTNVSIGAYTVIDRGVLENTEIGDNTKIGHMVHIAHNVKIGRNNLIVDRVGIGGSSVIGNDCFIGYGATILNKIRIGNGCTIGAGSVVTKDVPDGETWYGNPARKKEDAKGGFIIPNLTPELKEEIIKAFRDYKDARHPYTILPE